MLDRWQKFLVPENRAKLPQLAPLVRVDGSGGCTARRVRRQGTFPARSSKRRFDFEAAVQSALAQARPCKAPPRRSGRRRAGGRKGEYRQTGPRQGAQRTPGGADRPKGLCGIPADKVEGLLEGARKGGAGIALKQQLEIDEESGAAEVSLRPFPGGRARRGT